MTWSLRRYAPPPGRVWAAIAAAVWEAFFWVSIPYLVAAFVPGVDLGLVVPLGALISLCAGVEKLLPGHVVGAAFGLLGSALKIFIILGATSWGTMSFEAEGRLVTLDVRLIDALLTVPIVVSLVGKMLSVGVSVKERR